MFFAFSKTQYYAKKQVVMQGHTSRGVSGALYLQSAIARVITLPRGRFCVAGTCSKAMRLRSCATEVREPCQAGNRAAISGVHGVIQGCRG